jgi:hypothetical protein
MSDSENSQARPTNDVAAAALKKLQDEVLGDDCHIEWGSSEWARAEVVELERPGSSLALRISGERLPDDLYVIARRDLESLVVALPREADASSKVEVWVPGGFFDDQCLPIGDGVNTTEGVSRRLASCTACRDGAEDMSEVEAWIIQRNREVTLAVCPRGGPRIVIGVCDAAKKTLTIECQAEGPHTNGGSESVLYVSAPRVVFQAAGELSE